MTISELAKATGIHIETVRYYERRGLLPAPARRPSGYRVYTESTVARLHFIKNAQGLGFSLVEIKKLLTLRVDADTNCAEVSRQAEAKLVEVEGKLQALQQIQTALTHLVAACERGGAQGECPILESLEDPTHEYVERSALMTQCDQPTTETAACCTMPSIGNGLTNQPAGSTCPHCGVRGKIVDTQTLKAMLAVSLVALQPVAYYFCPTVQCPVVYFATGGRQPFTEAALRERVYQKHPDDAAVFVCYCFRHTLGTIRAEGLATKASAVIEQIKTGIAAGQCACEIRNPQGSCCLGNVSAVVKRTMQEAPTVALEG